jgi:hypothetical protein
MKIEEVIKLTDLAIRTRHDLDELGIKGKKYEFDISGTRLIVWIKFDKGTREDHHIHHRNRGYSSEHIENGKDVYEWSDGFAGDGRVTFTYEQAIVHMAMPEFPCEDRYLKGYEINPNYVDMHHGPFQRCPFCRALSKRVYGKDIYECGSEIVKNDKLGILQTMGSMCPNPGKYFIETKLPERSKYGY